MGDIDVSESIEILTEIIREQGEAVFKLYWDSGGPGAGLGKSIRNFKSEVTISDKFTDKQELQ